LLGTLSEEESNIVTVDDYRLPRPCASKCAPLMTWFFLIFANFIFLLLEVFPHIDFLSKETLDYKFAQRPKWIIIAECFFFELMVLLALWSHLKTLFSNPGFIPRGYNYNNNLMTPTNVSLLNYITINREKLEIMKLANSKFFIRSRSAIAKSKKEVNEEKK
jgi:hypothetical protein